ncbi:MAG: hypothetical protein CMH25_06120 [Micavibrio sp.]|nr:hypothetical protein [Micavibrio sp.]|tara:strand:+ start:86496 stop:87899 length:1404 start_codon:yes stop_codon:yes gene_type:complete
MSELKILHIEDNFADAFLLKSFLDAPAETSQTQAFEICHITELGEAVKHLEENFYHVVLLDLNLPDGQGVENLKRLKASFPDVPIIVITGINDNKVAMDALRYGAQEYIVKEHNSAPIMKQIIQSSIYRKWLESDLYQRAFYDALTGLPNRSLFEQTVKKRLASARRQEAHGALCFLDVNDFKVVNDTYGHDMGNEILKEVASRLQKNIRDSDIAGRYAGDEFILFLDNGDHPIDRHWCTTMAHKIVSALSAPITLDGQARTIKVSFGLATFPESAYCYDSLFKRADVAMYKAKARKGTQAAAFEIDSGPELGFRSEIPKAINTNRPAQINLTAAVLHDLKAPLRALKLNIDALQERNNLPASDLKKIGHHIEMMSEVLSVQLGQFKNNADLKYTSIRSVIKLILDDFVPDMQREEAEIVIRKMPTLFCHEHLLKRVFLNVILNAFHYHSKKRPLRLFFLVMSGKTA